MGVSGFGSLIAFVILPKSLKISIIFSVLISSTVQVRVSFPHFASAILTTSPQSHFANRVRVLSKRNEFAAFCWTVCVVRFGLCIWILVEELRMENQIEINHKYRWLIALVLSSGAANDLLIAGGLTYVLRVNRTGMRTYELLFTLL